MTLNEKLLNAFRPIVEERLRRHKRAPTPMTFTVTEIEDKPLAHIFTFDVVLPPKVRADQMCVIANHLDEFCVTDGADVVDVTIDNVVWTIGDGDDGGAVVFHDNAFHIWVRHFK